MQGFGFGGEWSVGAVLIAEMIQAKHRGKAVGLVQSSWAVGWERRDRLLGGIRGAAARQAWRVLFWLGILPVFLIFYIRRNIKGIPRFSRPPRPRRRRRRQFLGDLLPGIMLKTTILASLLSLGMMGLPR